MPVRIIVTPTSLKHELTALSLGLCAVFFLLPEARAGLSQADVVAVIFVGIVEIVFALHVVAAALLEEIGVHQVPEIGRDRVRGHRVLPGALLPGNERVGGIVRLGQRAYRGA